MKPTNRLVLLVTAGSLLTACAGTGEEPTTNPPASQPSNQTTTTITPSSTTTTTTTVAGPSSSTTTEPAFDGTVIDITVTGETVSGGGRISVPQGSPVRLVVNADSSDEVHLHGYDLAAPVEPDTPALIEFVADIPGVFEIEFEGSGLKLGDLEVSP
ncbi:MAG: hypothetical protein ACLGHX_00235 [Acidimicrobiia bacterium]